MLEFPVISKQAVDVQYLWGTNKIKKNLSASMCQILIPGRLASRMLAHLLFDLSETCFPSLDYANINDISPCNLAE